LVLNTYVLRVQYSYGVVLVFWFWWEIVFGATCLLSVQYSCAVVSFFWLWWKIVLKMRTRFYKHLLCVGWRNFFPVVLLYQFLVLAGNRFWVFLLCTYVLRVQYSCGVVLVFWFWWEIVFGVMYVLSVQYSCAVVSVLWLWQEIVL
jgi:hypothetical protein